MQLKLTHEQAIVLFRDRLLARKTETASGCWTFVQLTDNGHGYVQIHARPARISAHRLAFYAHHGYLPVTVLHNCDNPWCFRPSHLRGGTQKDNILDMDTKGRRVVWHPVGQMNPASKISRDVADEIRAAPGRGIDIARKYGVSKSLVSAIKRREVWRDA